jgi:hypothetical protein
VPPESLVYREEVKAILGVLAGITVLLRQIYELLEEEFDGEKGRKKETPEERAQWQRNHDRLQRRFEKRLEQEGVTKEEALRRLRPNE